MEITTIVNAINLQNNPNVPLQHRDQAITLCNELKNHPNATDWGFDFLDFNNEPLVRFFGAQLLEHVIGNNWNQLSMEQKEKFKKRLMHVIEKGTMDILEEQMFMKEKIADLFAQVAKREWPQNWEDLLFDLFTISKTSHKHKEMVIIVYKSFTEAIMVFSDDIPTARRTKMSQEIKTQTKRFMFFYNEVLSTSYEEYKTAEKLGDIARAKPHVKIIIAALNALKAFVEWIEIVYFEENKVWPILFSLLLELPFRLSACECLVMILERPLKQVQMLFPFEYIPTITQAITMTSLDMEQDYVFAKRTCQMLSTLGLCHLNGLFDDKKLPPNYAAFLELLLVCCHHPSYSLANYCLPFWITFLDNQYLKSQAFVKDLVKQLLLAYGPKSLKIGWPEDDIKQSKYCEGYKYIIYDVSSENEFNTFISPLRCSLRSLLSRLAKLYPELTLQYLVEVAVNVFKKAQLQNNPNLNLTDWTFIEIEGLTWQIEHVLPDISSEVVQSNTQVKNLFEMLFHVIYEFKPVSTLVLHEQLTCLSSFPSFYKIHTDIFPQIIFKIITDITVMRPGDELNNLHKHTIATRRKACFALLRLCDAMPQYFLPFLDELINKIEKMFSSLLYTEQSHLLEALVSISNGIKQYHHQSHLLTKFLTPLEKEWESDLLRTTVSDIENFVKFLGIGQPILDHPNQQELIIKPVRKLLGLLNSFYNLWKRANVPTDPAEQASGGFLTDNPELPLRYPLAEHDKVLLPNLLMLIRTLHHLWSPEIRVKIPQDWRVIYEPDSTILLAIFKTNYKLKKTTKYKRMVQDCLWQLQFHAYTLIGKCAVHRTTFYGMDKFGDVMKDTLFFQLQSLEDSHMHFFLKHCLTPIVTNCPPSKFSEVLPFTIETALQIFSQLVSTRDNKNRVPVVPKETMSVEEEIQYQESVLTNITRDYALFLDELFLSKKANDPKMKYSATPQLNFLLQIQMMPPLLYSLVGLISMGEGTSCRKAMITLTQLIPHLLTEPLCSKMDTNFLKKFIYDTVMSLLNLLSVNLPESHSIALALISKIIMVLGIHPENMVLEIFQNLPNVTGDNFKTFYEKLNRAKEEQKHQPIRHFITNVLGITFGEAVFQKKNTQIIQLPSDVIDNKYYKRKADSWRVNAAFAKMVNKKE